MDGGGKASGWPKCWLAAVSHFPENKFYACTYFCSTSIVIQSVQSIVVGLSVAGL